MPEDVTKAQLRTRRKYEKCKARQRNMDKVCPFVIEPFPPGDLVPATCPYSSGGDGSDCRYSHDVEAAYSRKLPDLPGPCPVLSAVGTCPNGRLCRWSAGHSADHVRTQGPTGELNRYSNNLSAKARSDLQRRSYDFERTNAVLANNRKGYTSDGPPAEQLGVVDELELSQISLLDGENDKCCIRTGPREKRKIEFTDKLFLAPMETLGNLPYRRLCKRLGAEVTCSEMAVATNLLQGKQSEWALLRRHHSEDLFGVQLCGAHVDSMTRTAQLIDENCCVDFVDINCGCPIDMVWKKGSGVGLMQHANRLESIVKSMDSVLSQAVVTVKMRTGVKENRSLAHQLIPVVQRAGAALVTIHGRSRDQRFTRLSDWDYIKQCNEVAKPGLLFGNGDVLSYDDYQRCKEASGVSGIMIARGALIKPWIFTEICERRTWDISAGERFDLLRDFTNYGLEVWGSDARGVETTRHFLLEWLSFLYRYVPCGLLEQGPQRINERPPVFVGRSDLETLLSSEKSSDWIRISEMLLGPVPDEFTFTPRHKANAY